MTSRSKQRDTPKELTLLTGKPYTVAAQTDIVKTFKRMGWVPPSEVKSIADKQVQTA